MYYIRYSVPLPGGCYPGLHQRLNGWCMSSGIHMTAMIQGFPAEHCTVMRWSVLITSGVSVFNVVADQCISKCIWCIGASVSTDIHERLGSYHQNSRYHYILTHSPACSINVDIYVAVWLNALERLTAVLSHSRCGLGVAGRVTEDGRCTDWGWHLLPLLLLPAHKCHHSSTSFLEFICALRKHGSFGRSSFLQSRLGTLGIHLISCQNSLSTDTTDLLAQYLGEMLLVLSVSLISTSVW